ncbi:MAG: helix-turn-helix domain-containing protein, partial [Bacteroidales bacterium]
MENQMSMGDQLLAAIRQTIEENIGNENFSVSDLAKEVGLSRSALHRNLVKLTGKSPSDLITEIRLTKARELLENNSATVSEIAYNVGFTSPSYFDKVFKKVYHVTPGELRRKGSGKSKPSNKWKIVSYISIVVIAGLIVLSIIPRSGKRMIVDRSIAVLPFINDSQDQENEHFINGIMEELLINLQSVKDLRVPGRTSTEQYRNNPKSIPEIASELNVAYIVEGSGQRYGDKIRLRVQLVEGETGKTMWADTYDEVIRGTEDIFRIQHEIAQSIVTELQAVITPEEMEIIEKIPTTNLTALTMYQKGRDAFQKYQLRHDSVDMKHDEVYYAFQKYQFQNDSVDLNHAEAYFQEALKQDPEYARAYVGLAKVYWRKHYLESYFSGNFLDSVLITANTALSFDDKLSDAYFIRGSYYYQNGNLASAEREFDIAIALNPNDWEAYYNKALLY